MRWKTKPGPNDGDLRVRRMLLLVPFSVNGETRWLTCTKVVEDFFSSSWKVLAWEDQKPYPETRHTEFFRAPSQQSNAIRGEGNDNSN